jgi:hypothetical protein
MTSKTLGNDRVMGDVPVQVAFEDRMELGW